MLMLGRTGRSGVSGGDLVTQRVSTGLGANSSKQMDGAAVTQGSRGPRVPGPPLHPACKCPCLYTVGIFWFALEGIVLRLFVQQRTPHFSQTYKRTTAYFFGALHRSKLRDHPSFSLSCSASCLRLNRKFVLSGVCFCYEEERCYKTRWQTWK